jgi:hypothetical protein
MPTDILVGFVTDMRFGLLKPWSQMPYFQAFDLERGLAEQGFDDDAYGLVITANLVPVTASAGVSLRRFGELLGPGIILGLVELTRLTMARSMIFGGL